MVFTKERIMASIKYNPNGQKGKITYSADIVSGIVRSDCT